MNRLQRSILLLTLTFPVLVSAQLTTITASNITDSAGNKLASGKICFLGTDQNNTPISYRVGVSGQVIKVPVCATVTSGTIAATLKVADTAQTFPQYICYRVTIQNNATGLTVLAYPQPGQQPQCGPQPTGTTWSFDNYSPNYAPIALQQGGDTPIKPTDDCHNTVTSKVIYDKASNQLSCGTDQSGGAGSTVGGNNKYVQFNDSGAFGGDINFQWDKTLHALVLGSGLPGRINSTGNDEIRVNGDVGSGTGGFRVMSGGASPISEMTVALTETIFNDSIKFSGSTLASHGTANSANAGTQFYCNNCNTPSSPGAVCATGGDATGAIAYSVNSQWRCYAGGAGAALTNPMTTLGDIIFGDTGGTPTRLAGNTQNDYRFLVSHGNGSAASAPTFTAIAPAHLNMTTRGDFVTVNASGVLARLGKGTQYQVLLGGANDPGWGAVQLDQPSAVQGILPANLGGTGLSSWTLHALYVGNGSSTPSVVSPPSADAVLYSTTGVDPSWKTMPTAGTNGCAGANDVLQFNTATHLYACRTIIVPYIIGSTFNGKPTASLVLIRHPTSVAYSIATNCVNSQGVLGTASTGSSVYSLRKNNIEFGTMTFASSGTVASFSCTATSFAVGDVFTIVAPSSQNTTAADFGASIYATR